ARRRGDGQQLRFARPDGLRAAGDVGGLADRLATTVEKRAPLLYRWTSHRPVVSPEGRVFRRPGNRQALMLLRDATTPAPGFAATTSTTSAERHRGCRGVTAGWAIA